MSGDAETVEVYRAALMMACIDGWADGAGAFEHYVGCARQAAASARDPQEPPTERVPLHVGILGRIAVEVGDQAITDYWTRDGEAFVVCEGGLGFFVDPDSNGELTVEVLR